MTRFLTHLLTALAVFVAACNGETVTTTDPPTSTTSSTTTTLAPTTTTVPFSIDGAPDELVDLVEGFYAYATGESTNAPAAPEQVIDGIAPSDVEAPRNGSASMGVFEEQGVAVVEMESDFFLAIDDGDGWRVVGGDWPSVSVPAFYGPAPRLIAVVGSDARPGETVEETRADSIHFVGLDGAGGGAVVGVPRDSYVSVPGYGRQKITASLALGGPDTMMAAFDDLTGLPLEGYVLTGFAGFESLVEDVLGAIRVEVPFAINDRWAHVNIGSGEQDLGGAEALGFARARKTVPGGDFTRSEHQGMILIAAARMVKAMGVSAIPQLMEKADPHLQTNLTAEQLLTFSASAVAARLNDVDNVVAPGSPGWAGSASVVYLAGSAGELWADLADGSLSD